MKPPKTYMSRVHKPLCSIWAQCFVSTTYAARKRTRHPEKHELPPSRKRILEEQTFQKAPETLEKLGELFCASKFADANHRRTHGLRIFKDKEKEAMNWNQGTSRMQFTQLSQLKVLVSFDICPTNPLRKQSTEVSNAAMLNPSTPPESSNMDLLLYIYIFYILKNNQSCCLFANIWYPHFEPYK